MTDFLVSLLAVAGFSVAIYLTGIVAAARRVTDHAGTGVSAMLDSALSDDEKEQAVRRAGLALVLGSGSILWRLLVCLGAAALPVYLAEWVALTRSQAVFDLMLRLDYILGVSLALILLAWLLRRRGTPQDAAVTSAGGNGAADRFLHMLAFSGPGVQKALTRLENRLMGRAVARVDSRPPVLVTSLARGGTTAVLNALNDLPGTATLTYRDMPFVTAPLLWGRLSAPLKRKVERRKRAHGDGLSIDLDSPDAFDEVYWQLFWPEKYRDDHIALWTAEDGKPEANRFFDLLFRKLSLLRGGGATRYLSKNNANIARLPLLRDMFEGTQIVVPLRRPAAHANSLLRQHRNFVRRQGEDAFTRRYMRDIGHLEFGLLHKPIAFEGFNPGRYDPATPDYWLVYWIAAFREVQRHGADCLFLAQDDLRQAPVPTMQALCRALDMQTGGLDFAAYFRSEPDETDRSVFDPDLLAEAEALYDALAARAVR